MNQFNLLNILNTFVDTAIKLQQNAVGSNTFETNIPNTAPDILLGSGNTSAQQNTPQNMQQVMQENSAVIKEALQLPQDLKDLVGQLAKPANEQGQNAQNQQGKGWSVDTEVDLNMLTKLLGENPKETMNKLVQAMAKDGNINAKSIKSALASTADVGTVSDSSNSQVIKNVLLLYLPYLPFDPEKKNFNFDVSFSSGGEDDIQDQGIELMIKTENYGNIKAYLNLGDEKTVHVLVNCNKAFPTDLLNKLMQKEAGKNKVKIVMTFSDKNQPTQNALGEPKKEGQSKEVRIKSSSSTVKSGLILMSYALIKSVFEIDKG